MVCYLVKIIGYKDTIKLPNHKAKMNLILKKNLKQSYQIWHKCFVYTHLAKKVLLLLSTNGFVAA